MAVNIRLVDVAMAAGVSRVAAGCVLLGSGAGTVRVGEKTAERIRRVADELGYIPNRSAQRIKSGGNGNLIGVVINTNGPDIELRRLVCLERLAWQREYQLAISALPPRHTTKDVMQIMATLRAQGAAGIVFVTAGVNIGKLHGIPQAANKVVYCSIPPVIGNAPGVVLDLASGFQQAVRHFAATGRKRIGMLHIQWKGFAAVYAKYRSSAIGEEAQRQGMVAVPIPVRADPEHSTPSLVQAETILEQLLANGVDAVMAYSDLLALRMLQVLHNKGIRVPEEMAVCGLNNLDVAALSSPALTTIDERSEAAAAAMLDLMFEQLQDEASSQSQRVIQPQLIVRESA